MPAGLRGDGEVKSSIWLRTGATLIREASITYVADWHDSDVKQVWEAILRYGPLEKFLTSLDSHCHSEKPDIQEWVTRKTPKPFRHSGPLPVHEVKDFSQTSLETLITEKMEYDYPINACLVVGPPGSKPLAKATRVGNSEYTFELKAAVAHKNGSLGVYEVVRSETPSETPSVPRPSSKTPNRH